MIHQNLSPLISLSVCSVPCPSFSLSSYIRYVCSGVSLRHHLWCSSESLLSLSSTFVHFLHPSSTHFTPSFSCSILSSTSSSFTPSYIPSFTQCPFLTILTWTNSILFPFSVDWISLLSHIPCPAGFLLQHFLFLRLLPFSSLSAISTRTRIGKEEITLKKSLSFRFNWPDPESRRRRQRCEKQRERETWTRK